MRRRAKIELSQTTRNADGMSEKESSIVRALGQPIAKATRREMTRYKIAMAAGMPQSQVGRMARDRPDVEAAAR